jgi:hypothetical protein
MKNTEMRKDGNNRFEKILYDELQKFDIGTPTPELQKTIAHLTGKITEEIKSHLNQRSSAKQRIRSSSKNVKGSNDAVDEISG